MKVILQKSILVFLQVYNTYESAHDASMAEASEEKKKIYDVVTSQVINTSRSELLSPPKSSADKPRTC